jgi:ComF family protein
MHCDKEKTNFNLTKLTILAKDIVELILPSTCLICQNELTRQEKFCCSLCFNDLQFTHFEKFNEPTPMDQLFWGRSQIHSTFALLDYEKGKSTQVLLHELKYNNNPALGEFLGGLIAKKLKNTAILQGVDALVPVPIHHRKRFTRGYNQSEEIAKGISKSSLIPIQTKFIAKSSHVGSQTKRGRFLRWDNVSDNFSLPKNIPSTLQHIAIIDDVVTTGATIEAMVASIHKIFPNLRITIISLAITK